MIDLHELLELLESAEDDIHSEQRVIPMGLDKAIDMLHKEIHSKD
jgi:hypothetical protein